MIVLSIEKDPPDFEKSPCDRVFRNMSLSVPFTFRNTGQLLTNSVPICVQFSCPITTLGDAMFLNKNLVTLKVVLNLMELQTETIANSDRAVKKSWQPGRTHTSLG
jgi:hypothetical protein